MVFVRVHAVHRGRVFLFPRTAAQSYPLVFTTLGLGIAIFIVLILIMEFFLFREFIDGLYPRKPSENIVGIIKPKSRRKPKRILIFGGHHDSALQFNYLRYFKNGYFVAEGILIFGVGHFHRRIVPALDRPGIFFALELADAPFFHGT